MDSPKQRDVDCPGRFADLTSKLEEAFATLELKEPITFNALRDAYDLISHDIPLLDGLDPYFNTSTDLWRPKPLMDKNAHLELVPLTRRRLEDSLPLLYAERIDAPRGIANLLGDWHKGLDLGSVLGLRLADKQIGYRREKGTSVRISKGKEMPVKLSPERASLRGYQLKTAFGIGPAQGDLVVPDAPYGIQVLDSAGKLSLLLGFWYTRANGLGEGSHDSLVVGQIQQPRGACLPGGEHAQMGIVGHEIAKIVARGMGMRAIQTYSADRHPMFYQYPDRKPKMKGEFKGLYDVSAKALGFDGSPSTNYVLDLERDDIRASR